MVVKQLFVQLRERLCAFCTARTGNVTIIFALAIIPIIGAVGAAVDYSHASSDRTAMQAAVDATALMLSKNIATLTTAQINAKATSVFTAMYTRPEITSVVVTPTYTSTGTPQIVVTASGTMKTSFVSLIGFSQITIGATSTVKWGNSRLRVALVLDNTGSMVDSGKIAALQTATKNLLTQLQTAAVNNGDVYVSIVPFVKDVNLGSSNYNQTWVYWDDAAKSDLNSWDANNGACSKSGYSTRSTCTATGTCSLSTHTTQSTCTSAGTCSLTSYTSQSTCIAAGTCSKSSYTTQTTCTNNGKTWTPAIWTPGTWTASTWTPTSHSTWNGCIEDRGLSSAPSPNNYDTNVTAPTTSDIGSLLPAEQYSYCPQAVIGLSYNWSSMTTLINNMSPGGSTNQAIGLELGWMSLSGGGPFTVPAMDTNYKYQQVIILLTDGLNTQDRWYGDGSNPSSQVDARQTMTCANLKAAGITLYTVQVNTGGDPTSTLLQTCASDSSKFFLLTTANAIVTTFNQIGTALSNLRVAK
jgi:Flp pilus assembly protein TadG